MSQMLEMRRENAAPKCANCSWWQGGESHAGHCGLNDVKTLDLGLCAAHKPQIQTGEIVEEHEE